MTRPDPHATGELHEPERGPGEHRVEDPAGRPEPYVMGPTGPAPVASELRGDPGSEGDRRGEGGAAAGALAGTAVAGPVGAVVGGVAGGALGSAADEGRDRPDHDPDDPAAPRESNTQFTDKR